MKPYRAVLYRPAPTTYDITKIPLADRDAAEYVAETLASSEYFTGGHVETWVEGLGWMMEGDVFGERVGKTNE